MSVCRWAFLCIFICVSICKHLCRWECDYDYEWTRALSKRLHAMDLSGQRVFSESTSVKAAIHVLMCKPLSCQWSDFEECVTGLPFQDHSLVYVLITHRVEQKTHCESQCTPVNCMYLHMSLFLIDLTAILVSERSVSNKELCKCVSSGHLVKDCRESTPYQAIIWAASTFCCRVCNC